MDNQDTIGARIRQVRKTLGMTQQKVADSLGVQQSLLALWERGRAETPSSRLYQLAAVLNCRREWLETGAGEMFEATTTPQDREIQRRILSEMFARLTTEQQELIRAAVGLLGQGLKIA